MMSNYIEKVVELYFKGYTAADAIAIVKADMNKIKTLIENYNKKG